jgi:hypothetical protein
MASLSGNKIKDTYNILLKLESGEASSSEQVVEDGAGNGTALKLSTDTVETTGDLKISGTPSTSTSDVKALMLSTSGVVVTRDLNTNPIGTASITANAPLSATGSTVELDDPANISQITSPADNDKYLIWDESASEYKYIEQSDLASSISGSIGVTTEQSLYARPNSSNAISSTAIVPIQMAEIYGDSSATGSTSAATSSVVFGTGAATFLQLAQVSDPRDTILLNEKAGYYRITASIELDSSANTDVDLQIYDYSSATSLGDSFRTVKSGETYHAQFSILYYSDGLAGYYIQMRAQAGASGVTVNQANTFVQVEYIGTNESF